MLDVINAGVRGGSFYTGGLYSKHTTTKSVELFLRLIQFGWPVSEQQSKI